MKWCIYLIACACCVTVMQGLLNYLQQKKNDDDGAGDDHDGLSVETTSTDRRFLANSAVNHVPDTVM